MTQEEKAKAYDEAIKRAKDALNDGTISNNTIAYLQDVFPELKDSEDERMRKWLINEIKVKHHNLDEDNVDFVDKAIAWLEKQGEPNPYSGTSFEYNEHTWGMCARDGGVEISYDGNLKAFLSSEKSFICPNNHSQESTAPEPIMEAVKEESVSNGNKLKFKVGDWIVYDDNICKIMKMSPGYQFYHCYSIKNHLRIYNRSLENEIHLWTIQDAKDGDIIYAKSKFNDFSYICIFFKLENGKSWDYCYISSKDSKHWNFEYGKGFLRIDCYDFYPASKEQRDLLFYKMKESDYEWNSESKEVTSLF